MNDDDIIETILSGGGDFATGDFATTGYDVGATPALARGLFGRPGAQPAAASRAAQVRQALANPATAARIRSRLQNVLPSRAATLQTALQAGGISEAEARLIVREELDRLAGAGYWNQFAPPPPANGTDPDVGMFPMGLGSLIFTAASAQTQTLIAKPQRGFRGERLVLSVGKPAAYTGIGIIDRFQVGDSNQLVGGGSMPVDVFSTDAFGVRLSMDPAGPGVDIMLTVTLSQAPVSDQVITISGAVIGRTNKVTG